MPTLLHHEKPKARKEHRCDNCGRVIRAGETYDRSDIVYDDQRYAWKSCRECELVIGELSKSDPETVQFAYDEGLPPVSDWLDEMGWRETYDLFVAGWGGRTELEILATIEADRERAVPA